MRSLFLVLLAGFVSPTFGDACQGVTMPSRPVKVILGAGPGGSAFIAAHTITEAINKKFGVRFTVEPKPGASGSLAARDAAKSMRANGETLYFAQAPEVTVNPQVPALAQNGFKHEDFKPIAYGGSNNYIVMCKADALKKRGIVNPTGLQDILDYVQKSKADKNAVDIIFAHGGSTNMTHLMALSLGDSAKIPLRGITPGDSAGIRFAPYKDTNSAMNDVLGGHVDCMIQSVAAGQGSVGPEYGIVALGTFGKDAVKLSSGKEVAPVRDVIHNFEPMKNWLGFFGSKDIDPKIAACYNHMVRTVLADAEVKKLMEAKGFEYSDSDPASLEQFAEHVRRESGTLKKYAGWVDDLMNNRPVTTAAATQIR